MKLGVFSLSRATSLTAALALLVVAACSSSNGPSLDPNKTDCDDVCNAAEQCLNANQATCSSNCQTKASNDSSYASAVKSCSDCTTTKTSCADLTACSSNCLSAVTSS
jgi:hypothetical protein